MDYLPKLATIAQTCEWLHAHTGQTWILPRLLECHLKPYFWLDYTPGNPVEIFGNKKEGYLASMVFAGDTQRLEVDATDALVTMCRTHDGNLFKTEPGMRIPLSELRFKRESIERVAEIINASMQPQPQVAPESAPVVQAPANAPIAPATGPTFTMTKAAMIEHHRHEWPTIEQDIKDANRNRLSAAKAGARGWHETGAMEWARANNRLTTANNTEHSLAGAVNRMASLPTSQKHTLED